MPTSTIEGLYENLIRKNSEIYIQRSKKIRDSGPVCSHLLAWVMTDVEIMAMADVSLHGTEKVTNIMREIDAESPWPEEGLEFSTLWCRYVHINCSEWKVLLRYIKIYYIINIGQIPFVTNVSLFVSFVFLIEIFLSLCSM